MIKTQQSFSAAVEKPVAPVRCIVQNLYFNFKTFASVRHVCVKEHSLTFQYLYVFVVSISVGLQLLYLRTSCDFLLYLIAMSLP